MSKQYVDASKELNFGHRLRRERHHRKWTQEELAEQVGTSKLSVIRWENAQVKPRPFMLRELYAIFGKTEETFGVITPKAIIWNVPFERNPYFRGREHVLLSLHKELTGRGNVALTQHALSGLGGIGKTQTAVEYAYRYAEEYDAVLWVRADSRELLVSEFTSLSHLLNLKEKTELDQRQVISAVKFWLQTHASWLLIFDNVEDIEMISDFLPKRREGAVLLTTRAQVRGKYIKKIDIDKLSYEESVRFLCLRAKLIDNENEFAKISEKECCALENLCELLDGLPLALDQAAAYMEENQYRVTDYLQLFLQHPGAVLNQSGTFNKEDYPYSVATTWRLSFQKVEQANHASAGLLYLCAFLHPDAIPEEIITRTASQLGPNLQSAAADPFAVDAIIKPLFSYSLVRRNMKDRTLTIHRLVQTVIKERMSKEAHQQWAERTVRAVNEIFPDGEFATWPLCERYLPHAQACAALIEQNNIAILEAAYLLNRMGYYLGKRARYVEAEPLLQRALAICKQHLGLQHSYTAEVSNNLAMIYTALCKYEEVEPLYQHALTIRKQQLGLQHPHTAITLHNLAVLYHQERYTEAESLYIRALTILEQQLGPHHRYTATVQNNLARIYSKQDRYIEAEWLWQRVLTIREQVLGADHPDMANVLIHLARLYIDQRRYTEAEPLLQRALAIREQHLGREHPDTLHCLHSLASLYSAQGRYEEMESLFKSA